MVAMHAARITGIHLHSTMTEIIEKRLGRREARLPRWPRWCCACLSVLTRTWQPFPDCLGSENLILQVREFRCDGHMMAAVSGREPCMHLPL